MQISKLLKFQKVLTYILLGIIGLGAILFIIGLIANFLALDVIGVLLVLVGVSGASYLWSYQKDELLLNNIVKDVKENGVNTIEELAKKYSVERSKIRDFVQKAINNGMLAGYVRVGESVLLETEYRKSIEKVSEEKTSRKTFSKKCPNCGAIYVATSEIDVCPYCAS